MPEAVANPVGHFEPIDIVNIHDKLLRSAGTKWSDWSRFPAGWYDSPSRELFVDELVRAVRENYGDSDLLVVKDPRMARFVPVWREVLSKLDIEPVAVIPYRNPIEVAQSLRTRDRFTIGQSLLLWLRHCLDAEADTRGMARCFVSYERLVGESQMTAYRMMEALPIAWPRKSAQAISDISSFLDGKLHRQKVPVAGLNHPGVSEAVGATYASLVDLETDEADRSARARLDELRSDLDTTASVAFAAFEGLAAEVEDVAERRALDGTVRAAHERVEQLAADLARLTAELQPLKDGVAAAVRRSEDDLARFEASDVARFGEIEGLRSDLATMVTDWRASQASWDGELHGLGERLRRVVGRLALDAVQAERKPLSRLGRIRHAGSRDGDGREDLSRFVLGSGLFDPDWYRARYGDPAMSAEGALDHYVTVGFDLNHSPGPDFDAAWYLETNPDVQQAGMAPLLHYIRSGSAEGRRARPKLVSAQAGTVELENEP